MLNIHAPVIPAFSAAGFQIGQNFSDLSTELADAHIIDYHEGFDLNRAINNNAKILIIKGFGNTEGYLVYFGPGIVHLVFSARKILGCIYMHEGYLGSYKGTKIGSPLSTITALESLSFDDGDEMYYRVNRMGEYIPGLTIIASCKADLIDYETTPIQGFCVHNWSIFRRGE